MRSDWVPLSASALVVGAMSLVFGTLLNPSQGGDSAAQTLRVVEAAGGRWIAMAAMYFFASFTLTLGIPAILTLFERRGRGIGLFALGLYTVGTIGTCGFAMLMVFFRSMIVADAVKPAMIDAVSADPTLKTFLFVWIGGFYGGLLLLAIGLFVARTTPRWVPGLLGLFVLMLPFSSQLGRVGSAVQLMALTAAFTGIAIAAVGGSQKTVVHEPAF